MAHISGFLKTLVRAVLVLLVLAGAGYGMWRGDDLNRLINGERIGDDALLYAAVTGDVPAAEAALRRGANVNARYDNQCTPLFWAAWSGDARFVRALLDHGAEVNVTNLVGFTPLLVARRGGHAEVVEILLAAGADPELAMQYGHWPGRFEPPAGKYAAEGSASQALAEAPATAGAQSAAVPDQPGLNLYPALADPGH